jgi:hypothetical protein
LALTDAALLAECDVDRYRASGPGGQHRNKVETAIRLRHRPSGIIVTAEERRSQAENHARALSRLRKALALHVRHVPPAEGVPEPVQACIQRDGRLRIGQRDQRYLPAAAAVLDILVSLDGNVGNTARRLGITTGNLSAFLTADADLLVQANRIRAGFGLHPLRAD